MANGVFFALTILSIRKKRRQLEATVRRFSRAKVPTDRDVHFYVRISSIMGFQWAFGFLLGFYDLAASYFESRAHEIVKQMFIYAFILLGSSVGLFIFVAFVCKRETKQLYRAFFQGVMRRTQVASKLKQPFGSIKRRIRQLSRDSLPSTSTVDESLKTRSVNSLSSEAISESFKDIIEVNERERSSFSSNEEVFAKDKK